LADAGHRIIAENYRC